VFREYDIRGVADSYFPSDSVIDLGRAIGTYFLRRSARSIAVGQDCRKSSPRLFNALTEGLLNTGIDVVALGEVLTPLTYFAGWPKPYRSAPRAS
jgi:phosphomannomutase/phosphoglucomutase